MHPIRNVFYGIQHPSMRICLECFMCDTHSQVSPRYESYLALQGVYDHVGNNVMRFLVWEFEWPCKGCTLRGGDCDILCKKKFGTSFNHVHVNNIYMIGSIHDMTLTQTYPRKAWDHMALDDILWSKWANDLTRICCWFDYRFIYLVTIVCRLSHKFRSEMLSSSTFRAIPTPKL